MQYRTVLTVDVPRVECTEHGVKQVRCHGRSRVRDFSAVFESLAIDRRQGREYLRCSEEAPDEQG